MIICKCRLVDDTIVDTRRHALQWAAKSRFFGLSKSFTRMALEASSCHLGAASLWAGAAQCWLKFVLDVSAQRFISTSSKNDKDGRFLVPISSSNRVSIRKSNRKWSYLRSACKAAARKCRRRGLLALCRDARSVSNEGEKKR